MFRLKPKEEPLPLPFRQTRRRQQLAERQKRIALMVNRSLDRASGFSWSPDRQAAAPAFPASLLRLPAHAKVAAAASVVASLVLVGAFLAASRSGLPTLPPVVWVKSAEMPVAAGADGSRYREISALRMQIAEAETSGRAETAEVARLREELMFERAMAEAGVRRPAR